MTKTEVDFETWFSCLTMQVLDGTGVTFQDEDSVRGDYDSGRDVNEVAAEIIEIIEIIEEYGGAEE